MKPVIIIPVVIAVASALWGIGEFTGARPTLAFEHDRDVEEQGENLEVLAQISLPQQIEMAEREVLSLQSIVRAAEANGQPMPESTIYRMSQLCSFIHNARAYLGWPASMVCR